MSAWKAQVIDRALEENLRDYVSKVENRDAVWAEVQNVCQKLRFQKVYASAHEWACDGVTIKTKAGRESYRRHRFDEPLDIMLAKYGKLRSDKASLPIAYLRAGEGQQTKAQWDRIVEFWVYIRDELRRNGVDAQLLFRCGYQPGTMTCKHFDIDDVDKFRYKPENLEWLPDTKLGL